MSIISLQSNREAIDQYEGLHYYETMSNKYIKIKKLILFALCLFFAFFEAAGQSPKIDDSKIKYIETCKDGFVPTEQDAISIAKIVLRRIYGEKINEMDFVCELREDNIWHIKGVLPEGRIGGVPYIKIRKSDGKIMGVMHTK